MDKPDFYLASTESYMLAAPRRCWRLKRLESTARNDLLLSRIDPPLPPMSDLATGADRSLVIFLTRHVGDSLFPINRWPMPVHLAVATVVDPAHRETLRADEFKSLAWAELYRTEEDAQRKEI
jgi:hypothetical protein